MIAPRDGAEHREGCDTVPVHKDIPLAPKPVQQEISLDRAVHA
jgi:hypothetical protein